MPKLKHCLCEKGDKLNFHYDIFSDGIDTGFGTTSGFWVSSASSTDLNRIANRRPNPFGCLRVRNRPSISNKNYATTSQTNDARSICMIESGGIGRGVDFIITQ